MSRDPVAQLAEEQSWLAPAEEPLQDAVRSAFQSLGPDKGRAVRDALHGTWLHEPLHAVLTDIPIGSWTVAAVLDGIAMMGGSRGFNKAADAAVVIGLVGAAGAAVTGLNDWADVDGAPRRIGLVHAMLNIGAVGMYLTSSIARKRGNRTAGRVWGAVAYLVVSASAHLGGNLVYEHGVGVESSRKRSSRGPHDAIAGEGAAL